MKEKKGKLVVITGPMFSGKTEELIHRIREASRKNIRVFHHRFDNRYGRDKIISHSKLEFRSVAVADSSQILNKTDSDTTKVYVDEIQFFDSGIIFTVQKLLANGLGVIVAGLDRDFRRRPFPTTEKLIRTAHEVVRLRAVCSVCRKRTATLTRRISSGKGSAKVILIGGAESYEPRCLLHYKITLRFVR